MDKHTHFFPRLVSSLFLAKHSRQQPKLIRLSENQGWPFPTLSLKGFPWIIRSTLILHFYFNVLLISDVQFCLLLLIFCCVAQYVNRHETPVMVLFRELHTCSVQQISKLQCKSRKDFLMILEYSINLGSQGRPWSSHYEQKFYYDYL